MQRNYVIFKEDLNTFLAEITSAMATARTFYNVATKEHKDQNKIVVVVG